MRRRQPKRSKALFFAETLWLFLGVPAFLTLSYYYLNGVSKCS